MLIVLNIDVEAGEIEAVGEVVFIDFTEIFVTTGRDELEPSQHLEYKQTPEKSCEVETE